MSTKMFGVVAGLALIGTLTGDVRAAPTADPAKNVDYKPDAKIEELSVAEQLSAIESQLKVKLKDNTLKTTVRLSARKPWIAKKAMVDLDYVDDVSTRHDQVSFVKYGLVRIGLRSTPGYAYFVECGVGQAAKLDINVHTYDASANPDDEDWFLTPDTRVKLINVTQDVIKRKVTFSFAPTGLKDIGIELRHHDAGPFVWHYCKITPIKM
jgi:hypothetical protein